MSSPSIEIRNKTRQFRQNRKMAHGELSLMLLDNLRGPLHTGAVLFIQMVTSALYTRCARTHSNSAS